GRILGWKERLRQDAQSDDDQCVFHDMAQPKGRSEVCAEPRCAGLARMARRNVAEMDDRNYRIDQDCITSGDMILTWTFQGAIGFPKEISHIDCRGTIATSKRICRERPPWRSANRRWIMESPARSERDGARSLQRRLSCAAVNEKRKNRAGFE